MAFAELSARSLRGFLGQVSRRSEVRQAGLLVAGTTLAQVVTLVSAPVLARLYGPEQFGALALMMTINTIAGAVGGLSYEMAIIAPKGAKPAQALFALVVRLSLLVAAVTGLGLFALDGVLKSPVGADLKLPFYALCALGTALTTLFTALGYVYSRSELYRGVAVSKINQSLLPAAGQVAFGLMGAGALGLVAGRVAGLAGTVLWLFRGLPNGYRLRDVVRARVSSLGTVGRRYSDFTLNVPRQLLVRSATGAPPLLIAAAYGPAAAGLFFFAQRIVERPGMLLGETLSRVPMKQYAMRYAEGRPILRLALVYSAVCAAPVLVGCLILAVIAPYLFGPLFGREWAPAADYAVILAVWSGVRLSALPMSSVLPALRKQKANLALDVIFAGRPLAILAVSMSGGPALTAVAAFCGLSVLYDLSTFGLGLVHASRYDRGLRGANSVD